MLIKSYYDNLTLSIATYTDDLKNLTFFIVNLVYSMYNNIFLYAVILMQLYINFI